MGVAPELARGGVRVYEATPAGALNRDGAGWRERVGLPGGGPAAVITTLGVYRFWATARQRRYLWSRTQVIDDTLEWTGTGKEMFIGFLIVIAILAPLSGGLRRSPALHARPWRRRCDPGPAPALVELLQAKGYRLRKL